MDPLLTARTVYSRAHDLSTTRKSVLVRWAVRDDSHERRRESRRRQDTRARESRALVVEDSSAVCEGRPGGLLRSVKRKATSRTRTCRFLVEESVTNVRARAGMVG